MIYEWNIKYVSVMITLPSKYRRVTQWDKLITQNQKFPSCIPLVGSAGTWKPPYEAFDVLRVKIIKGSNWWASGERGCLLIIGQDKVPGRPNNWLKKKKTEIEICCKILCENVILKYGLKVH